MPFSPRAAANDDFVLVYALRQVSHQIAFTQAPIYCLYFCDHFADIVLLKRHFFQNQMKNRRVWNSRSPDLKSALPRAYRAALKRPDSPAIIAFVTLLRSVSLRFGTLLRSALDRWCLGDDALRHSYNPPIFLSRSSDWGRGVLFSTSSQPPAAVALMAYLSRSFDRWLLSHWCFFVALSVGSSVGYTLRTSPPFLALSTGPRMFPALCFRSLRVTSKSRVTCPGSCSGAAVLALIRPVVPYTLAISSALLAGGISGIALFNSSTVLADWLLRKFPTA